MWTHSSAYNAIRRTTFKNHQLYREGVVALFGSGILHIEDCNFFNNGGQSSARQVDWHCNGSPGLTVQLNVSETTFSSMPGSKHDIYMASEVRPQREQRRLRARPLLLTPLPTLRTHSALPHSNRPHTTFEIAAATRSPTPGP